MNGSLTFLHLSDIHFRKRSGAAFDVQVDVRRQLEQDLREQVLGGVVVAGVMVSGDIAFSGATEEYKHAIEWLQTLSDVIAAKNRSIWVVPGNHDVDRATIAGNKVIRDIHDRLRNTTPDKLDLELAATIAEQTYAEALFKPMANYVHFAAKFSCGITPEKPWWEESFTLNDGSELRIRGMTSTLISDESDGKNGNRLLLGCYQAQLPTKPGVSYMVLTHHPCDCLYDGDAVTDYLDNRASLQLFGHKHQQHLRHVTNGAAVSSVRMVAGAVHPDGADRQWLPRYNLVSIRVANGERRNLEVAVRQRVWSQGSTRFVADCAGGGTDDRQFLLPLSAWKRQAPDPIAVEPAVAPVELSTPLLAGEQEVDSIHRELAYKFLTLPYHRMVGIAIELGLVLDEDEVTCPHFLVHID